MPFIAGAGICCLDHIMVSPRVAWGDTAFVSNYDIQGGGLVATALVACARLGAQCELLSMLGDDATADQTLAELVTEQVGVSGVVRVPSGKSPVSFIHVDQDSGERTIFHRSGAGLCVPPAFDSAVLAACDALIIDDVYPDLALAAARTAREVGKPVVADLIPNESNAALLNYTDALIVPRHYLSEGGFGGDTAAALEAMHALGPSIAVITLGSDGWVYSDAGGQGCGESFKVNVVDTTGAGDTFHGAFAYSLTQGWETARCCEFASAVAAIKCTAPGGRTGLPSMDQTLTFLRQHSKMDYSGFTGADSTDSHGER